MKTPIRWLLAASLLVISGGAMAQVVTPSANIPNGLSGPGGSETFTPGPAVPSASDLGAAPGTNLYGSPTSGQAGRSTATSQRLPTTTHRR